MTVCIAGMHRSGTSMVARLLNLCGLYLGREDDLIKPEQDNPEGFWENVRFVRINNALLAEFGGGWDLPPILLEGWVQDPRLVPLRVQASVLIQEFGNQACWGWKDPRTSLTLPFWQELVPNLRVIICLRNPLEVADSLYRRGYSSRAFSHNLWQTYNEALLLTTRPEERLVTHQAAYFVNPQSELQRVLKWLGWSVPDKTITRACASISTSARHHRLTVADLEQAGMPASGIELYQQLCAEAGATEQSASNKVVASSNVDVVVHPVRPSSSAQRIEGEQSPAAQLTALIQTVEKQQRQIESLEQERRRLQDAYQAQTRWARELEANAQAQALTLRAYQRALVPLRPFIRLWRQFRNRRTTGTQSDE